MEWYNELLGPLDARSMRAEIIYMGADGWELVNGYYVPDIGHFATFRRPAKVADRSPEPDNRRTRRVTEGDWR
jgi:hypothetical protein